MPAVNAARLRRSIAEARQCHAQSSTDRSHGRRRWSARRTPGARGLPPALEHGPAVVAAHPGRGAADAGRGRPRRGLDRPTTARTGAGSTAATSRSSAGPTPYTVADDPATAPQAVIHPGQRCTTPEGRELEQMMDLGVRTWGNSPDGVDGAAHRHLPARRRGQPAPAARAADAARPARRRVGLAARPAARRRDRQGRARPGGGARPAARPAADRRAAGLVRPPGRRARRAGTARTATRSSAARCG